MTANEQSTPDNPSVKKSLYALLTPYMAKKLSNESPVEVRLLLIISVLNRGKEIGVLMLCHVSLINCIELKFFIVHAQKLIIYLFPSGAE